MKATAGLCALFVLIGLSGCSSSQSDPDLVAEVSTSEVLCSPCVPDCEERVCGSDGCGGLCGECGDQTLCVLGQCAVADPGDCEGVQCGPDGMGGLCGQCDPGWACDQGLCRPEGGGCGLADSEGICMEGWRVSCKDGELSHEQCPFNECEEVKATGDAICPPVECIPDCWGRTCGEDGCGGTCGTCGQGLACDPLGICVPSQGCGDILDSACLGQVLAECREGALVLTSCPDQGQVCGTEDCDGPLTCRNVWPEASSCNNLPNQGLCRQDHYFSCKEGFLQVDHCGALGYLRGPVTCARISLDAFGCTDN